MAKHEWSEFEIKDFAGIATSKRLPAKNECQECLNLDLRETAGDMITRSGYGIKYNPPTSTRLSNVITLSAENFYIPDIGGGKEITVLIQTATLIAETRNTGITPADIPVIAIWISSQWDSVNQVWVDGWVWLNELRLTTLAAVNVGSNNYVIDLDYNEGGDSSSKFTQWTITNLTKSPYESAAIIISAPVVIAPYTFERINITNDNNYWIVGDTVILQKNYIPYDYLVNMGTSVLASDIVFHKVLNDIRIGFGGQANRLGLNIGYRQKYFKLNSIAFGSFTAQQVENLVTIDGIILDPYYCFTESNFSFITDIASNPAPVAAGAYFFYLTALLDDFEEFIVGQTMLANGSSVSAIIINPIINFGSFNKRITKLRVYCSIGDVGDTTAKNPYYFINEIAISDVQYLTDLWEINTDGQYQQGISTEQMTDNNAANTADDGSGTYNNSTGFSSPNGLTVTVDSTVFTPNPSTYKIKATNGTGSIIKKGEVDYTKSGLFTAGKTYTVTLDAMASGSRGLPLSFIIPNFTNSGVAPDLFFIVNSTYQSSKISFSFTAISDSDKIGFYIAATFGYSGMQPGDYFEIDNLSIKETTLPVYDSTLILGTIEMADNLGYTPSTDYVKSWDQAIIIQGKTFLLNPYIDKRILNKIFFSPFLMYDVITADNYYDAETFDGNDIIGIQPLPNGDIEVIRKNSSHTIDSLTGKSNNIKIGFGGVSRRGVINFGDKIAIPGTSDIYMTDGLNYPNISEETIRDQYRQLTSTQLGNIIGTREEKDNSYRFFTGDTVNKTEFILTKRGWIKRVAYYYPEKYIISRDNTLWFLNNGTIYFETNGGGDKVSPIASTGINYSWKSVPIDTSLMGEQLTGNMLFYIGAIWLYFKQNGNYTVTINIYLDGNSTPYQTITTPFTTAGTRRFIQRLVAGANCRSFEIEITGSDGGGGALSFYSVGVQYKILPEGRFARSR